MARPKVPIIPDDKINYYREQLYRELSHMFRWEGLPQTVPKDYLERNLVRFGYVMYYEDESIGQDVLRATPVGFNRHELPTSARTFTPSTTNEKTQVTRNVKRLADKKNSIELFDRESDCVLIANMAFGQTCHEIVEHFAQRLALAQQAFDTNLLWANVPYIFLTADNDTKLSIESMFASIFSGQPFIISDKNLYTDNKDRTGVPTNITFIGKELMDVQNEIMMKFRQTVGFNTAGVDKAERVNTLEIQSNNQHTQSVVQVMLEQRQIACEAINAFFGASLSVDLIEEEIVYTEEGEEEYGTGDSGVGSTDEQDEL
jgi:hypothetical protein